MMKRLINANRQVTCFWRNRNLIFILAAFTLLLSTLSADAETVKSKKYKLNVNGGTGSGRYYSGTGVDIKANDAPEGSVFTEWTGDVETLDNRYAAETVCLTEPRTITVTANYGAKEHTIVATCSAGGSITPAGSTTVENGGSQSYSFTPDEKYVVGVLTIDGVNKTTDQTYYLFYDVSSDHTIHVTFYKSNYHLFVNAGTADDNYPSVNQRVDIESRNILSTDKKKFTNWSGPISFLNLNPKYPFNSLFMPPKDLEFTANYLDLVPVKYNLRMCIFGNNTLHPSSLNPPNKIGTMTPNGAMTVTDGEVITVVVTMNPGYSYDDVVSAGVQYSITSQTDEKITFQVTVTGRNSWDVKDLVFYVDCKKSDKVHDIQPLSRVEEDDGLWDKCKISIGSKEGKDKILVKGNLPESTTWSYSDFDPEKNSCSVFFSTLEFPINDDYGTWKVSGKEGAKKFSFTSDPDSIEDLGLGAYKYTMNSKDNTWSFQASKLSLLQSLTSRDAKFGLWVSEVGRYLYTCNFTEKLNWQFKGSKQTAESMGFSGDNVLTTFSFGKKAAATCKYFSGDDKKPTKGALTIKNVEVDIQEFETDSVKLFIDDYEVPLGTFTKPKEDKAIYIYKNTPETPQDAKISVVFDLEKKNTMSVSIKNADLSEIYPYDGVEVVLMVGDYLGGQGLPVTLKSTWSNPVAQD